MEKLMKSFFRSSIITSIILIVLGLLLFFQSEMTIIAISYVIGGILIVLGVVAVLRFVKNTNTIMKSELDIVYGIVSAILGALIIKNPEAIASIVPIVLGISIIISSANKLQYAFELRANNNNLWKTTMVLSLVSTICGIVLLFNPFKAISYFTQVVGAFIVIYAVLDMISTITIKKNVKIFQDSLKEGITEAIVVKEETNAPEDAGPTKEIEKDAKVKSKNKNSTKTAKKED